MEQFTNEILHFVQNDSSQNCYTGTLLCCYTIEKLHFFNHHCIPLSNTDTKRTQCIFFVLFLKFNGCRTDDSCSRNSKWMTDGNCATIWIDS